MFKQLKNKEIKIFLYISNVIQIKTCICNLIFLSFFFFLYVRMLNKYFIHFFSGNVSGFKWLTSLALKNSVSLSGLNLIPTCTSFNHVFFSRNILVSLPTNQKLWQCQSDMYNQHITQRQ